MKQCRPYVLAACVLVVSGALEGCALKFEARLLDPFNRPASGSTEGSLVARARHLLLGGLSAAEVEANLGATGQTPDEARRIVALAVAANVVVK